MMQEYINYKKKILEKSVIDVGEDILFDINEL